MPKVARIVPVLALALFVFAGPANAQLPPTTQSIGGWAKPAQPGTNTNADGFTPAPRTPNMIWQSSLITEPGWLQGGAFMSDFAFTRNLAINAEYNNFRIVDISDPRNPVTLGKVNCPGSQGDVVVFDNIVVKAHEGTHIVPHNDLDRACETGGNEIQTVSLSGFDQNGDSFRLQMSGGGQTPDIIRGTNFTAAGIQQAIQGRNEVQQVAFTGFNSTNSSFRVRIGGNDSQVIGTGGLAYTNANIASAINAIAGFPGTVTVTGAANSGFSVTFGGASSATDVPLIEIVNLTCAAACGATVSTTTTPLPAIAGWPAGGTVTIGALSDSGFTMTFAGAWASQDVPAFSVVAGTGGTTGTVVETRKGQPGSAWRGITIHDISDPRNPKFVKAVTICGSTHTITKYFDDVTNTMYVFGTGSGTTTNRPDFGLTECSSLPVSRGDVVEIPRNNPRDARLLQHNYIPMGFQGSCHDSNAFEELHLIAVACSGGGGASMVDVSDFKNPKVLWTYTYPGLQTTHSAAFSWDGKYVYINGEPGGGSSAECAFDDDTIKPMIHILETMTGKLVGMWMLPRPQDRNNNTEACTTHTINTVPFVGKHLIANSCYMCGISVIDVTNPRAAQEIAYVDPVAPQTGGVGEGCWTGYWYNDNLYCNELAWGMHIFTVSDSWWKQAMDFEELNPQTNTRLIRCDVSVTGVPARAGQTRRITVKANLFGPAPRQPGWGLKVRVTAPGIGRTLTTGENGTASVRVRVNRAGRFQARIAPAANLPFGCQTRARQIKAAAKPRQVRGGGGGPALSGRIR